MLINIDTKQKLTEYELRSLHTGASFPVEITDEAIADFGYAVLNYPAWPTAAQGKKIVDDGVEQIDGKWFAKYVEVDLSAGEVEAYADGVRADRNKRLSETDWRFRSDMTPSQEWKDYCQALRDIPNQDGFPFNVTWPVAPA